MWDAIVIGSGIGGLSAAGMLARYGRKVLVCESHAIPGGAAHAFARHGYTFDSGPSFYSGLGDARPCLNPLRQVLDALGESIEAIAYDPLGYYHFPEVTLPIRCRLEQYRADIAAISPRGAEEFARFARRMLDLYACLQGIPAIALRADWQVAPLLLTQFPGSLLKALPHLNAIRGSAGDIADATVRDPWVRRAIDLECFLLSGLKADGTIAPEVAMVLGERDRVGVEYPVGGSGAIVAALVRGLQRWGGELRLNAHVEQILVENGKAVGVRLKSGSVERAPVVISNASIWDTYGHLLAPELVPDRERHLQTPHIDSFMHLHAGIAADGLDDLAGHHVVVHSDRDLAEPGNTCMISIPSVWDPSLAPAGRHVVHAYTLEPSSNWSRDRTRSNVYAAKKRRRAEPLYRALERVIPDFRERLDLELIGTPLTHARYLRRDRGTYGPAIHAQRGTFPGYATDIPGLYRVGDSTMPGIGVPAVAASGILCANSLVSLQEMQAVAK